MMINSKMMRRCVSWAAVWAGVLMVALAFGESDLGVVADLLYRLVLAGGGVCCVRLGGRMAPERGEP